MMIKIGSKKEYHQTMVAIFDLMNKGEANLTEGELDKMHAMAVAAEHYEDSVLGLRPPVLP